MKFSYRVFKKLVPSLKSAKHLSEVLTNHLFEVEGVSGDAVEIKILANRYSDAASYWGIARVVSAALGKQPALPKLAEIPVQSSREFGVSVKVPKLCRRMAVRVVEGVAISPSPAWLVQALAASGIRSINNLVDITNYVTYETGQPLHAFDLDKMQGAKLIVRSAQGGEVVETLDGSRLKLDASVPVLADEKFALDIAGVKGGKRAEITKATKNILLTVGSFDGVTIYKSSRTVGIRTDASLRFSHDLSPELVSWGIARASELILDLCKGKAGPVRDWYGKRVEPVTLKFELAEVNAVSGLELKMDQAVGYLAKLGFEVKAKGTRSATVSVPMIRTDVGRFEDLVEEIVSLHGVSNVKPAPPELVLMPPADERALALAEKVRELLPALGLSETLNYSMGSRGEVKLENPMSSDRSYLRESLVPGLLENVASNLRFFSEIRIFEIGHVFRTGRGEGEPTVVERPMLGLALANKKSPPVLELKGVLEALLERLGVEGLRVSALSGGVGTVTAAGAKLGALKVSSKPNERVALAELDLTSLLFAVTGDRTFKPLAKYPAVTRDISVVVARTVATGDLMEAIDGGTRYLPDGAEVVDFYESERIGAENQALTFRLAFRSEEKTLTDAEADRELAKVVAVLRDKFLARVR
jgi:phenylalanyl-tRNA synthetase beta chain